MTGVFQEMKNRIQRRSTYDCADPDMSYCARAFGLKGMKVNSTNRDASDDLAAQMAEMWTGSDPPLVWLSISTSDGVRINDEHHNKIIWYDLNEIAHCNVHRELDNVFVFVGQQNDELRCHAVRCKDPAKTRAICLTMSNAFQKHLKEWQRIDAAKSRSIKIEEAGKLSLLGDGSPTGRRKYASANSIEDIGTTIFDDSSKKSGVLERFSRLKFNAKDSRKWAPIPTADDSGDEMLP